MPPMSLLYLVIVSSCSATEEVKSLNEEAVPSVEKCSSVLSSCLISKNEISEAAVTDVGNDEESDVQILRSILNDGHYNVSAEYRLALEFVIATLDDSFLCAGHSY